MSKDISRYLIGIGLLIFAIILIIVGFNFFRNAFRTTPPAEQATTSKVDLLKAPADNQAVSYTVYGSVTGNEDHFGIRITVDRNARRVEALQGYNYVVIKTEQTANTQEAYQAFVAALKSAGFTKSIDLEGRGDEAQSCPLGKKYTYEVIAPGNNSLLRTWSNSCSTRQGTFGGVRGTVETLFQRQIPEYSKFATDVKLN
ncbi:MAG: hypothetical protein ACR2FM_03065 [Candidatus Saccharimonadales bacterium]